MPAEETLSLLACPRCRGRLDARLECLECQERYRTRDGIFELRLQGDASTERVRAFYTAAPFPGYPRHDSIEWLRARAEHSRFAGMLDQAIPYDARIADVGCGTGQTSLYLARGERLVVGADLCRASLEMAASAADRLGVERVRFVETDIFHPGLRERAFDVVHCSGVLHHTSDPATAFARIARLAKPGGLIVIGLYSRFARLPHRMRRMAVLASAGMWVPGDAVLADRVEDGGRYLAWLRDQYYHPEEHRHTLGEVRRWFDDAGVDYLRAVPSGLVGYDDDELALTDAEPDSWWLERLLAQLAWIGPLAREGGLFIAVGRARGTTASVAASLAITSAFPACIACPGVSVNPGEGGSPAGTGETVVDYIPRMVRQRA